MHYAHVLCIWYAYCICLHQKLYFNNLLEETTLCIYVYLPKTKKFGCVGRGVLTSLFFSKVVKY